MASRPTLSIARTALRTFSTCRPRFQESANRPQAGASASGFSALRSIFESAPASPASPAPSSSVVASAASSSSRLQAVPSPESFRGYSPRALPPTIDPILDLFTNLLMKGGLKTQAQGRVTRILNKIRETTNQNPIPLLHRAVLVSAPSVRVLNMRKSMKTIPTPRGMTERQRVRTAITWILKAAERGRAPGVKYEDRIAREILAVLEGDSQVFKWLEERHKAATLARSNMFAR